MTAATKPVLAVRDLRTYFRTRTGDVKAVDGVSYHVNPGEIVAFVGESGCGKSVTQYSTLQLVPPPGEVVGGEVLFEGLNLLDLKPYSPQMRAVRGGGIGVVFQEPMTSLNPVMTVGKQIAESIRVHLKLSRADAMSRSIDLLTRVGIPDAAQRARAYPHEFSGGMRQRVMIAMALACDPRLIIADEATTALDVTTEAQLLEMIRDVVRETETALILVTHNLGIVARYADRVYVMYAGDIVESGTTSEIFENPKHPYTLGLLSAMPRIDDPHERQLEPIPGVPPNLLDKPDRCPFMPRCPFATATCETSPKPLLEGGEHSAACYEVDRSQSLLRAQRELREQRAELAARSVVNDLTAPGGMP